MKKRISAGLMAMAMILSLAACGGKSAPTAEELIANGIPADKTGMSATMTMSMKVAMNLSDLMDGQDGVDSTMEMALTADIDMEKDEDIVHINGPIKVSMFGINYEQEMEQWSQAGDKVNKTWTKDENGSWDYSETEDGLSNMAELTVDAFSDLKVEKSNDEYIITGKLTDDTLSDMGLDNLASSMAGSDEMPAMKVTMRYDVKTGYLKNFEFTLDESATGDDVQFGEFKITFTVNSWDDVELTLPDELAA